MGHMKKTTKIGIIGAGHVGSHVASSLMTQGLCDEIVLLNHGELEVVEKTDLDSREFKDKIIAALREEGNE